MKIALEYPVNWRGSLVRAVLLRKPTVDEVETAAPGFIRSGATRVEISNVPSIRLLACLTDLPIELIGELDFEDFRLLCDLVGEAMGEVVNQERRKNA